METQEFSSDDDEETKSLSSTHLEETAAARTASPPKTSWRLLCRTRRCPLPLRPTQWSQLVDLCAYRQRYVPMDLQGVTLRPAPRPPTSLLDADIVARAWSDSSAFVAWLKLLLPPGRNARSRADHRMWLRRALLLTAIWYLGQKRLAFFVPPEGSSLPPHLLRLTQKETSLHTSLLDEFLKLFRARWQEVAMAHGLALDKWLPTDAELRSAASQLTQFLVNSRFSTYVAEDPETDGMVRTGANTPYAVAPNNQGMSDAYFAHPAFSAHPLWVTPHRLTEAQRQDWWWLQLRWFNVVDLTSATERHRDITTLGLMEQHGAVDGPYLRQWGAVYCDRWLFHVPPDWRLWRILREGPCEEDLKTCEPLLRLGELRGQPVHDRKACPLSELVHRPLQWLRSHIQRCDSNMIAACGPRDARTIDNHKRFTVNNASPRMVGPLPTAAATAAIPLSPETPVLEAHSLAHYRPQARTRLQTNPTGDEGYDALVIFMQRKLFYGTKSKPLSSGFLRKVQGRKWYLMEWGRYVATGERHFSKPLSTDMLQEWWHAQEVLVVHHLSGRPLEVWNAPDLYAREGNWRQDALAHQLMSMVLQQMSGPLSLIDETATPEILHWAINRAMAVPPDPAPNPVAGVASSRVHAETVPDSDSAAASPQSRRVTPMSEEEESDDDDDDDDEATLSVG